MKLTNEERKELRAKMRANLGDDLLPWVLAAIILLPRAHGWWLLGGLYAAAAATNLLGRFMLLRGVEWWLKRKGDDL